MAEGPLSVSIVKNQFLNLDRKLHKAAHGEAFRGVRKAMVRETLDLRKRIRGAALGTLPHKGGLNKWAAVMPTLIARDYHNGVTVTIRMQRGHHDFKALDKGRIRHPLFGKRGKGDWFTQTFPSGFFTNETERLRPQIQHAVEEAVHQYAEQFNSPRY